MELGTVCTYDLDICVWDALQHCMKHALYGSNFFHAEFQDKACTLAINMAGKYNRTCGGDSVNSRQKSTFMVSKTCDFDI